MPLQNVIVNPESTTTMINWKILGVAIGAVLTLSVMIIVTSVLNRRHDKLRDKNLYL